MQNRDDLKRRCLRAEHNGVVWIAGQRPETKGTACKVWSDVTAHGTFGNKGASVVDRSFYAVGGFFVVIGNVGPDIEYVRFGERRKNVSAHCLDKRHSSFIA